MKDVIGALAAIITTSAFVPQAWHIFRHRHTEGVSLMMYLVLLTGSSLWVTYGIMLMEWPLIVANGITLFLVFLIIVLKLRFR